MKNPVTPEKRGKALRVYALALDLIAEYADIEPVMLHANIIRNVKYPDLQGLKRVMESDKEQAQLRADLEPPATGLVTLFNPFTREYLSRSGKGTTRHKGIAYRGTQEQAEAARAVTEYANGMKIIPFDGGAT